MRSQIEFPSHARHASLTLAPSQTCAAHRTNDNDFGWELTHFSTYELPEFMYNDVFTMIPKWEKEKKHNPLGMSNYGNRIFTTGEAYSSNHMTTPKTLELADHQIEFIRRQRRIHGEAKWEQFLRKHDDIIEEKLQDGSLQKMRTTGVEYFGATKDVPDLTDAFEGYLTKNQAKSRTALHEIKKTADEEQQQKEELEQIQKGLDDQAEEAVESLWRDMNKEASGVDGKDGKD